MTKTLLKNNFGFTLVELMVAISIIGILSSIVYANFGEARKAARDDIRKTSLKELQLAVEFYKAENGRYPEGCRGPNAWSGGQIGGSYYCAGDYIIGLVPDFIQSLPMDPKPLTNNTGFLYRVDPTGSAYKILVASSVEMKTVTSYANEFARCPENAGVAWCSTSPQTNSYAVYSAGAREW